MIQREEGKVCGRFNVSQINRELIPNQSGRVVAPFYKLVAGLAVMILPKDMYGGTTDIREDNIVELASVKDSISIMENNIQLVSLQDTVPPFIEGVVKDAETGEDMIGVKVNVKGTNIKVFTDGRGKFKLSIDTFLTDTISLAVIYTGYETFEFNLVKSDLATAESINLSIHMQPLIIIGEVIFIKEKRKRKRS